MFGQTVHFWVKKKWQEEVRVNTKHFVLFPPPPSPFFFLSSPLLSPPFFRYSGATCGLAFVFVYPSLIYVISLHRAGQLTWPALIIHVFIILLGLANLIAQFLLWKPPSPCGCHKWYCDIWPQPWATLSHMIMRSSSEKLHLWNKFKTHLPGTWKKTCFVPQNTQFRDKWSSSNMIGVVLLLLNVHQVLMKLRYFNFLQLTSQNTQLSALSCRTPLSSKRTVLTFSLNVLPWYCSLAVWNVLLLQLFYCFVWKMKKLFSSFSFFLSLFLRKVNL